MRVRVFAPPYGTFIHQMVTDLLALPDDRLTDQTLANFVADQLAAWEDTILNTDRINEAKSHYVWLSQVFLVGAMLAAAIFTLKRVL